MADDEELLLDDELVEEETGDVYDEDALQEEILDDEIDPVEEGFMRGYDRESILRCDYCGKELGDEFITIEVDGTTYRFCSEECKEKWEDEHIL